MFVQNVTSKSKILVIELYRGVVGCDFLLSALFPGNVNWVFDRKLDVAYLR